MKIAIFLYDFHGGGAERVAVVFANQFHRMGHRVEVVVNKDRGPHRKNLDVDIPVRKLGSEQGWRNIFELARYFREEKPEVLFAHQTTPNLIAGFARLLAPCPVVVGVEHGEMQETYRMSPNWKAKVYYRTTPLVYGILDRLVCISRNVADSVRRFTHRNGLPIEVRPNPVIDERAATRKMQTPSIAWLADKTLPVIVAVGRMEEQKNYPLLLDAFAKVRANRPARLVILGEGSLKGQLEAQAQRLGIADDVLMPGFDDNPFACIRAADVLAMSSHWEGLPTVTIEALYCGTTVVSTLNSTGIVDILENGRHGILTPLGDADALAAGILQALDHPFDPAAQIARAEAFLAPRVAEVYLDLFRRLLAAKTAR